MSERPEEGPEGLTPKSDEVENGRREAMKRMAKYTAPAMLALLLSEKAMAATVT